MSVKLAINGFGRIGRLVARIASRQPQFEVVGINDVTDAATLAHLLKYDSVHGRFPDVRVDGDSIVIAGRSVHVNNAKKNPELPWQKLGVDYVIESTGLFTEYDKAAMHLKYGAKKVIISAPPKGEKAIKSLVMGVNHTTYDPGVDHIVSNASCTTNCVVPAAKVIHESFRIQRAYMTTIHAYTNDQAMLDQPHKDLRRARAGAMSMIPTSTGAAKLVGVIFPELKGKIDGSAIRVPTPDVSMVDLACNVEKSTTKEEVNAAFKAAAEGPLRGILQYIDEPIVSVDLVGNPHSSMIDSKLTAVVDGTLVKVFAWYDNEFGYANRLIDLAGYMASRS
ncbi:type I glyceraldehyde-3-phosphate dehydrogenase [candidate division WOR-3 bacterium]|uniref:Type I glyceraldehyde-3-phosphate dehydrogenase n=1 Tax=candidate division WOR-3 bacterium TaxID=2052148 RepID=A0A938BQA5_UNCW3|nr:type I glyceraldehyde-3-phosphate dehydrogenase [candidate division WOR-3 bacterium]